MRKEGQILRVGRIWFLLQGRNLGDGGPGFHSSYLHCNDGSGGKSSFDGRGHRLWSECSWPGFLDVEGWRIQVLD